MSPPGIEWVGPEKPRVIGNLHWRRFKTHDTLPRHYIHELLTEHCPWLVPRCVRLDGLCRGWVEYRHRSGLEALEESCA